MRLKQFSRLSKISYVWMKYGLDEMVLSTPWLRAFRFTMYLNPVHWLRDKKLARGVRLRMALEELGPIFVKFGQMLSTRRDLLPDHVAIELAKLQDKVPPFPGEQARAVIEAALDASVADVFAEFSVEPLASASIAQVHSAKLKSGKEVVIKVLRPGIEAILKQDIALMYTLAKIAERYWRRGKRLRIVEVVREIERNIVDELDLMREAANASQLKRNFPGSPILYVPEVYWDYCRNNVLVMERIRGLPVSDIATSKAQLPDLNLKLLAERGVEIFYTQVFRDGFFHADMHPGNIFVATENPQDPQYIAVDFGIMGTLTSEDQRYLAGNFLAFFQRDYRRVAELHVECGWVPPDTRIDELESAIRTVCEPIFERPLRDISFGKTLLRLFQIARRFHMEVQPQLLLLQKTLLNIEGMGRQLYPELDLWATARPFLERWMKERVGVKGFFKRLRKQLPYWSERLPDVPGMLYEILNDRHQARREQFEQTRQTLNRSKSPERLRFLATGLGIGLVISALIAPSHAPFFESMKQHDYLLAGSGLVLLLWAMLRR